MHEDLELPGRVMAAARALERDSVLIHHALDADDVVRDLQRIGPFIDSDEPRQVSAKVAHDMIDGRLRGA